MNKKNGDSLAVDISASAISGGNPSSERTKLDRYLFVEGFEGGEKRVLVDGSAGLKGTGETMDPSPPEDWRSWLTGGRSLGLFGVVVATKVCAGGVGVVVVIVIIFEVLNDELLRSPLPRMSRKGLRTVVGYGGARERTWWGHDQCPGSSIRGIVRETQGQRL
jgi:hypothetical protein